MLTKRLQEIDEAEKRAEEIYRAARAEAHRILAEAAREAEEIVERARIEARRQADRTLAAARNLAAKKREIYSESMREEIRQLEQDAMRRIDKAIALVLNRVVSQWRSSGA